MPDPSPLEVVILACQYTLFTEPVYYQWCAKSRSGLFAQPQGRSTTQTDISALLPPETSAALVSAGITTMYWGDDELKAELEAFLATQGVTAVVVDPNPDDQQPQG